MPNKIIELLVQTGIGSILGVIIGMIFQYFVSKKLRIFETKIEIFRKVYKQLYYFVLMNQEEIESLSDSPNTGISAIKVAENSGLDLKKDLGDILYYIDGDLEKKIGTLIYSIYQEYAVINKHDMNNIVDIMNKLKKTTRWWFFCF